MDCIKARALEIFDEYADMPHHRQSRALACLKQEDPGLHDALVELLAADALDHAMDIPPLQALARESPADAGETSPEARQGSQLGSWRIERLLSVGRMGAVYEAHRVDGQYAQRAALKCMHAEFSSPALIDTFLMEGRNLARLDHPRIPALLDNGVEPDGNPWFAMRYVDGLGIERWCDLYEATVDERVGLLVQACEAMAHAHDRHVAHQDITPDKLLVTRQKEVFLVGFGQPLALGRDKQGARRGIVSSNGYAAPETHTGAPPGFAGDIYAMGVVMYQLLCGDWPVPLHPVHPHIVRMPPAPRAMTDLLDAAPVSVARQRGVESNRKLVQLLRGDLDAIALKCVATDPAARYAHASELRADLQRWLARRPVHARSSSLVYRILRFMRRNTLACSLVAAAALSAGAACTLFLMQQKRIAEQAAASQQVHGLFERMLGPATLSGLGETRRTPRRLLDQTEVRLRALPLARHPAIRARGLSMLARSYAVLGDYPHALALLDESANLQPQGPGHRISSRAATASLLNLLARHASARDAAREGILLQQRQDNHDPLVSVELFAELARAHWGLSEHDAALAVLGMAQRAAQRLPDTQRPAAQAQLLTLRGQWQTQRYRLSEARQDLHQAIALTEPSHPLQAEQAREQLIAVLARLGHDESAMATARKLLQGRRERLGNEHPETTRGARKLAELLVLQGHEDEATHALAMAVLSAESVLGPGHPEIANLWRLQAVLASSQTPGAGLPLARQAVALLEQTLGPAHEQTLQAKTDLAHQLLAHAVGAGKQTPDLASEAVGLLRETVHAARQRRLPAPENRLRLAEALEAREQPDDRAQAKQALHDAWMEAHRYLGGEHRLTARIRDKLMRYHP